MDEALRRIEEKLRESRPASKLDALMPREQAQAATPGAGLGIEHYGKVSMVVEGADQAAEAPRPEPPPPPMDAASRIAAGSKELSLDELSSQPPPPGEALKTQQLGGSRFHELSLDDLSSPAGEGKG